MATSWKENEKLVLETLTRLESKVDDLHTNVSEMKIDLATHKVKSGFWGALSGMFMSLSMRFFGGH